MDSISPGPLSRCTSMAAAMMVSVSPLAFWNRGCIGTEIRQKKTDLTGGNGGNREIGFQLCYLCCLLLSFRGSGRTYFIYWRCGNLASSFPDEQIDSTSEQGQKAQQRSATISQPVPN